MKSTLVDYPNRFRSLQKEKEVIYLFISFPDFMSFCLQTILIIIEIVKLNNSNK